jgi:hypothetical protein
MKIYISTANSYLHLIKPFYYLFNKFWSPDQQVTVLGYDEPEFNLPNNFDFISLGKQEGGIKMWSTDLRKFFESIDDEFFIHTVEDHFLTWPVNFGILSRLISLLDDNVGRIGLTNDMPNKAYDIYGRCDRYDIIERRQDQQYRLSLLWGIWNREYILKYLEPGLDPHDFEIIAGDKAMNDGYKILGTVRDYCLHHCQGVRRGNLDGSLGFKFINDPRSLEPSIIEDMKKEGLI